MADPISITLIDKIPAFGKVQLSKALVWSGNTYATIFIDIDNKKQPWGVRLDLTKKAFLDSTEDHFIDEFLVNNSDKIVQTILNTLNREQQVNVKNTVAHIKDMLFKGQLIGPGPKTYQFNETEVADIKKCLDQIASNAKSNPT